MLELVKTRELSVEQAQPWGPIICRVVVAPARADAAE
jgi:chromatin segregation and condensation protein Rec8/ScpA/Scc1 (kleisin family)